LHCEQSTTRPSIKNIKYFFIITIATGLIGGSFALYQFNNGDEKIEKRVEGNIRVHDRELPESTSPKQSKNDARDAIQTQDGVETGKQIASGTTSSDEHVDKSVNSEGKEADVSQRKLDTQKMDNMSRFAKFEGKAAFDALSNTEIFICITKLIGADKIDDFKDFLSTSAPITIEGNYIIGTGILPHSGGVNEAAFAFNTIDGSCKAAFMSNSVITKYGFDAGTRVPESLIKWSSRR
jgi:hypothetical protein